MMHDAPVYLAGYLAAEPKFKKVAGDVSSTKLRIAYTARRQNRETGEWSDGATTFVNVQCWRHLADNVMCLRKGEPVLVFGRLRIRHYDDAEGRSRIAVEVEASSVGHDLTRGMAHFSRAYRSASRTAADVAGEHAADGPEAGGPDGGGAPNGDSVVDEAAVAEFARELSALGTDPAAEPEPAADAEEPQDADAEPAGNARS